MKKLTQAKSQTGYSTKNISFSKAGATLTCPYCEKQATYQIGQLDREEWRKDMYTRGKWVCKDCYWKPVKRATTPPPLGSFPSLQASEPEDIDKLLEMI